VRIRERCDNAICAYLSFVMKQKIVALVPAAGTGTRLGDALPKQYLDTNGHPLIYHALAALKQVSRVTRIVVVLSPDDRHWQTLMDNTASGSSLNGRVSALRVGGATRGESVVNGLTALAGELGNDDWVMVHDAARPCIRVELIEQFIDELEGDTVGGLLALPLTDTIKLADETLRVQKTLPREAIWRAQTPQMFHYGTLLKALQKMPQATDEAQAIEALGLQPKLVMGDSANLKVTYAPDLKLARMLLNEEE
jgi:2-C-methyl-D-erythritol 4-phosphate cytidylyltransferase